jgi:hypothetical protein
MNPLEIFQKEAPEVASAACTEPGKTAGICNLIF